MIINDTFPARQTACVEAIDKIMSYKGCQVCKRKKEMDQCKYCKSKAPAVTRWIVKVTLTVNDEQMVQRTIFHEDLKPFTTDYSTQNKDKLEDELFKVVGTEISFIERNEVISNIQLN